MTAVPRTAATTVAAFQVDDIQDDPARALAVMRVRAGEAVECGASVACFPEGFLTGYTRERAIAQRRALALDSPRFCAMLDEVADCTPVLVFGLIEASAGALFNTVVLVERGRVTGVYRKRHPNEACFAPGRKLPVFDVAGLRVGVGVCADARDHGDAARLAAARVDVILYPLNNMLPDEVAQRWRHRHVEVLIERARQTGAWVLSADVIGNREAHVAYGCTAAVDPRGVVGQRVSEAQAGMALAAVPLPAPR